MKTCCFLVTLFLATVSVNSRLLSTQEHVKRFFRPQHRQYLPDTTMLQLQEDEAALENVVQRDDSTKCWSVCEPKCDKLNIPKYLLQKSSFSQYEKEPINCVVASTVVFKKNPKCKWLGLYLFDCCRACNAKHDECLQKHGRFYGREAYCYRKESYICMCKCLEKHKPLENYYTLPTPTTPTK